MYNEEKAGSMPKATAPVRKPTLGSFVERLEVIERRFDNSIKEMYEVSNRLAPNKNLTESIGKEVPDPEGYLSRIDQLLDSVERQADLIQSNICDIGIKLGFND